MIIDVKAVNGDGLGGRGRRIYLWKTPIKKDEKRFSGTGRASPLMDVRTFPRKTRENGGAEADRTLMVESQWGGGMCSNDREFERRRPIIADPP